jgi:orotate phosphoribosyltransferase
MRRVTVTLPREQRLRELGKDIVHAGYLQGDFVLSSGVHSHYYFDKYLFVTKPSILRRLAPFLGELVPAGADRLAGPGYGGVALSAAVALEIGMPFLVIREPATSASIIGEVHTGDRVVLIEDVLATGSRALASTEALVARGADVVAILAVVDREEGAADRITKAGYVVRSLFTSSELGIRTGIAGR